MSSHNGPSSYGHRFWYVPNFGGYYVISWRTDTYYSGSRVRHPRVHQRHTDEDGAKRFAKRWGLVWEPRS